MLAEFGVRDEIGVALVQIIDHRIDAQPVLAGAELDLGDALAAQPLVGEQAGGRAGRVGPGEEGGERHAVLDRLVGALAEVRQHRMRRVAEQA